MSAAHDYEALDARLTVVEAQMAAQSVLARNVRDLALAVDALNRMVQTLIAWTTDLDARMGRVEERLYRIETKVDVLDGKFDIMLAILQARDDNGD